MSSKQKGKGEKEEVKRAERRPSSPPPAAVVLSRHEGRMVERKGKGFSLGELEQAGIGLLQARSLHVSVDPRRRSVLEANVKALKKWYEPPRKVRRVKKAEQEKPVKKRVRKSPRPAKA